MLRVLFLWAAAAPLLLLLLLPARAFYLPGVAPQSWRDGESVQVQADSLTSPKTRIPYDYYAFPFCKPEKGVEEGETLGEVLTGSRLEATTYDVAMGVDAKCRVLCQVDLGEKEIKQMKMLIDQQYAVNFVVDNLPGVMEFDDGTEVFGLGYWVGGIIIDQTDIAEAAAGSGSGKRQRRRSLLRSDSAAEKDGRSLQGELDAVSGDTGSITFDKAAKTMVNAQRFINNHVKLKLWWHRPTSTDTVINEWGAQGRRLQEGSGSEASSTDGASSDTGPKRIVRFEVHPMSYQHHYDTKRELFDPQTVTTCGKSSPEVSAQVAEIGNGQNQLLDFKAKSQKIIYSYSVEWIESDTPWATRWDIYLSMGGDMHGDVHWLSITNSILVAVFLSALVALIMVRTLRRDLMRYNRIPTDEEKAEEQEESGWKLVHGDVFRPPPNPILFSVLIGTGVQIFWMSVSTIIFAALGFLSPANRGSMVTGFIVLFVLMGSVGGFFSARVYKTFNGVGYQRTTLLTAFGFPGVVFSIFFIINLFVWGVGSSAAVPFTTMLALFALWFGISVPLCFFGAFMGYRLEPYEHPCRVNTLPRQIPQTEWYLRGATITLIAGVLPFACLSIELYFIMTSIWFGSTYYYVFGFLLLVGLLLFITIAEMSIMLCYFQLCGEDYRWWWRSFTNSASCAIYVFLYSIYFFNTQYQGDSLTSTVVYFGYTTLACIALYLMCGAQGFTATYIFTRKIFGSIKVD